MPSTMGTTLRVSVFGQSHSAAIGCVVEGLPAGQRIDFDEVRRFMARRAPGQGPWSTPRKEADEVEVVSGLNHDGLTCGTPLAALIRNTNTRSQDYASTERVPRPGHADFTAWEKWGSARDVVGGGHFSGRLTAPLCFAGDVALQALRRRGVRVAAHLLAVGDTHDVPFEAVDLAPDAQARLARQMDAVGAAGQALATIDPAASDAMLAQIGAARRDGDSVGGVIECVACGLPAGVGSPMFDGLENVIARAAFGIPGVKGVEFGRGFEASRLHGSQDNDPFGIVDGRPAPLANNAGGILGGISTGAPVLFRVAMKPTPSIARPQDSVDLASGAPTTLEVRGRHDPCIAPRAVPVVEAVCGLALLDAWLSWPPAPLAPDYPADSPDAD